MNNCSGVILDLYDAIDRGIYMANPIRNRALLVGLTVFSFGMLAIAIILIRVVS